MNEVKVTYFCEVWGIGFTSNNVSCHFISVINLINIYFKISPEVSWILFWALSTLYQEGILELNCKLRLSCELKVGKAAKDMDFRFGHHNSGPSSIFNSILSLSLFSANTADTSLLMVSVKCLHIFDLKSLHVKIIKSENSNRILNFKSEHKGL